MNLARFFACFSLFGAFLILSCASEPAKTNATGAKETTEKKEVSLSTARPCLNRMTVMALRWQSDALPYHVESEPNTEATGQDGKSTVWRANFASASRGLAKIFVCSGSLLRNSPPYGVSGNTEFPYSKGTTILTFPPSNLAVDSDIVAKLAQEHGGKELIKKSAQQPVIYELGIDPKSNKLLWAAVYGTSEKDNQGIAMIEATQPKFLGVFKH